MIVKETKGESRESVERKIGHPEFELFENWFSYGDEALTIAYTDDKVGLISTSSDERFSVLGFTYGMNLEDVMSYFSDENISETELNASLGISPTYQYRVYYDNQGNLTDQENASVYVMVLYKDNEYNGLVIQK